MKTFNTRNLVTVKNVVKGEYDTYKIGKGTVTYVLDTWDDFNAKTINYFGIRTKTGKYKNWTDIPEPHRNIIKKLLLKNEKLNLLSAKVLNCGK